jgi:hypothetical protein
MDSKSAAKAMRVLPVLAMSIGVSHLSTIPARQRPGTVWMSLQNSLNIYLL